MQASDIHTRHSGAQKTYIVPAVLFYYFVIIIFCCYITVKRCHLRAQEERKRRKEEEEAKKKEERLRKTAEFEKWKNPPKRNFVITKKADDEGPKEEVSFIAEIINLTRSNTCFKSLHVFRSHEQF